MGIIMLVHRSQRTGFINIIQRI